MNPVPHVGQTCSTTLSIVNQGTLQDIVPFDCVDTVRELFVPDHKIAELREEAETLPQLEITKLDTQWIQVSYSVWSERHLTKSRQWMCLHLSGNI